MNDDGGHISVSYTHLDVYKRQNVAIAAINAIVVNVISLLFLKISVKICTGLQSYNIRV